MRTFWDVASSCLATARGACQPEESVLGLAKPGDKEGVGPDPLASRFNRLRKSSLVVGQAEYIEEHHAGLFSVAKFFDLVRA